MSTPTPPQTRRSRAAPVWWGVGALVVLVIGLLWLAVTAAMARRHIDRIQAELPRLEHAIESDSADSSVLTRQVGQQADAAHRDASGPAWWIAAHLPLVGGPARVVWGGAQAVDTLASQALPPMVETARELHPGDIRTGDRIDLARLIAAQQPAGQAAVAIARARRVADALPVHTWLPAATRSRTTLVGDVDRLDANVEDLAAATRHLPPLLGADGARRYLLVFQNNAESRGLGGLPGAYGVLEADDGRLHFTQFGSDTHIAGATADDVPLPSGAVKLYGGSLALTNQFANATLSPDFPTDAAVLREMAASRLHRRIDGVLATDPTALSYLLSVTGPIKGPAGHTLTSATIVSELEQQAYAQFPTTHARKAALVDAARATGSALLSGQGSTISFVKALEKAVDQRRLLAWTRDPSQEAWLRTTRLGGALPVTRRPFSLVAVDNAQGSKLDYYLHRSVNYRRTTCAAGETETTATLTNDVPATPLPEYVTQHSRTPDEPVGYNQEFVFVYTTAGSTISAVTVNGRSVPFTTGTEAGHPVAEIELGMKPRKPYAVSVYAHEPAADGAFERVVQPLVLPQANSYTGPDCS